ncbi:MAG TPA: hypothetical protein VFX30_03575 [bacterium]|nr:hypothetical protein [bacterium]
MSFVVAGIPMEPVIHPQGPWLEGVTPVTNLQWRRGIDSLLSQGAKYCVLEPHYRGHHVLKHFGSLEDACDLFGRDNVPSSWDGKNALRMEIDTEDGEFALFKWFSRMSPPIWGEDNAPVRSVSWYHAKAWALSQAGLYLLTSTQWDWTTMKGRKNPIELWEWMERNPNSEGRYSLRNSGWYDGEPARLHQACAASSDPTDCHEGEGFRVGAPFPQDSK